MTIDTITREALIEKLKQYPTLLQQFMVLVDTQGTTLDDIQEILKLAEQAETQSETAVQKATSAEQKATTAVQKATSAEQKATTVVEKVSTYDEKINAVSNKIEVETNRALVEELSLQGDIETEVNDRKTNDDALQVNIDTKSSLYKHTLVVKNCHDYGQGTSIRLQLMLYSCSDTIITTMEELYNFIKTGQIVVSYVVYYKYATILNLIPAKITFTYINGLIGYFNYLTIDSEDVPQVNQAVLDLSGITCTDTITKL